MEALKLRGFNPATVIDVGVGKGTSWLYDSFPTARLELFEALEVFRPACEEICRNKNARYHLVALGDRSGTAEIDFNVDMPTSSTMAGFSPSLSPLAANSNPALKVVRQSIPIRRLDDFGPFESPILLKLDAEGFEAPILRGGTETLSNSQVLISEVSVMRRHSQEASFGEFISHVESLGFSLIDFAELSPLRRGGPLAYVDAVFVRSDGPFRR
jgi:FkbM family methyltransferase